LIQTVYRVLDSSQQEIHHTPFKNQYRTRTLNFYGYRVFPGGKVLLGLDADPSPRSSAEVKNTVELHLYSP